MTPNKPTDQSLDAKVQATRDTMELMMELSKSHCSSPDSKKRVAALAVAFADTCQKIGARFPEILVAAMACGITALDEMLEAIRKAPPGPVKGGSDGQVH